MNQSRNIPPRRRLRHVHWSERSKANDISIADLENKIGAGLIEEVIAVAEGEHKLVETMAAAQV